MYFYSDMMFYLHQNDDLICCCGRSVHIQGRKMIYRCGFLPPVSFCVAMSKCYLIASRLKQKQFEYSNEINYVLGDVSGITDDCYVVTSWSLRDVLNLRECRQTYSCDYLFGLVSKECISARWHRLREVLDVRTWYPKKQFHRRTSDLVH